MSQGWQVVTGIVFAMAFVGLWIMAIGSAMHATDKWRGRWPSLYTREQGRRSFFIWSSIALVQTVAAMAFFAHMIDASTTVSP